MAARLSAANNFARVVALIISIFEMRIARRFVISGRVQGVGFRYFVHDAATREGVAGWVTNLLDGRVEAFVEGEQDAVVRIERALRKGPSLARVEHVTIVDEDATGNLKGFSIR